VASQHIVFHAEIITALHCLFAAEPFWKSLHSLKPMSISFRREREHWVAAHRHSNESAEVYQRTWRIRTHTRLHACAWIQDEGFVMMEIGRRGVREKAGVE
jgi:hypothetical protein